MSKERMDDRSEAIRKPFPGPVGFSRLLILRAETGPSLALTMVVVLVLAMLVFALRTVFSSEDMQNPTVTVTEVVLSEGDRETLELIESEADMQVPQVAAADSPSETGPPNTDVVPLEVDPPPDLPDSELLPEEDGDGVDQALGDLEDARAGLKRLAQLRSVPSSPGSPAPGTDQSLVASLTGPPGKRKVTKGSFTVWTVPDDPVPGMNYAIVIQIRWRKGVGRVKVSDLSGRVIGTDGWNQSLPLDSRVPTYALKQGQLVRLGPTSYIPIKERTSRLIIWVPGASQLVRDRISIRSNALKENQTLEITF